MSREIDDLDFNGLRSKIIEIIGTGSGSYGYGQSIQSSPVYQGNLITKNQWDGLRNDLINILVHQTGITPDIIEIVKGSSILESDPLLEYNDLIESAKENRFNLASSQSTVTSIATKTFTTQWNTYAYATVRLNFPSSDAARFFFNSGGKLRISSSRTGGSSTAQNGAWTTVLNNAGTIEFGATGGTLNYYQLTNSYQTLFQRALSTPYSANVYRIQALCNVPNNNIGSATSITFEITWTDNYSETFPNTSSPPEDRVDGTLTLNIEELKAAGNLQPSGEFSIISPIYEVTDITAGYNQPPSPPPPVPSPAPPPPPPDPPPVVIYNETVSVPSTVSVGELFSGIITGGAPNTSFSVQWKTSSGSISSSGTQTLDSSGNFNSGSIGVFADPDTYTLTVRFDYTGNVVVKTTTVLGPIYRETISVPALVQQGMDFEVSVTGGFPGTGFSVRIYNAQGGTILINPLIYLDSSGNFSSTLGAGVVPKNTYTWEFNFFQGSGNIYYKTTVIF